MALQFSDLQIIFSEESEILTSCDLVRKRADPSTCFLDRRVCCCQAVSFVTHGRSKSIRSGEERLQFSSFSRLLLNFAIEFVSIHGISGRFPFSSSQLIPQYSNSVD